MIRRFFLAPYMNEPILSSLFSLFLVFGLFVVYSTTSILSFDRFGTDMFYVSKHVVHILVGLGLALFFAHIKLEWLNKNAYLFLGLSILLLTTPFIPGVGIQSGGAKRWIALGNFSFQPSEFCKLAFLLYLAASLSKKIERGTLQKFSIGTLPHVFFGAVACVILILQPDFGTAMVYLALLIFLLFVAGIPLKHLFLILFTCIPIAILEVIRSPYRIKRVLSFLNPWEDPMNQGFQVIQSLLSFSSGGFFGKGIGNSQGKLFFVPEFHSDFVFSIMGEELGLVGILLFLILWCCFIFRGFKIARLSKEPFVFILASGATFLLLLQSLIHMMVNLSLLPAKGMNLPFMSTGGSNLILCMILTGILLNCSTRNKLHAQVI